MEFINEHIHGWIRMYDSHTQKLLYSLDNIDLCNLFLDYIVRHSPNTYDIWDEVSRIKREFRGCTRQPRWGKDKEKYFEKLNHVKKICLSLKP